jgi:hypothetical protein
MICSGFVLRRGEDENRGVEVGGMGIGEWMWVWVFK